MIFQSCLTLLVHVRFDAEILNSGIVKGLTMQRKEPFLKERFLSAVNNGELGSVDDRGVIVTLKEFKRHFTDIKTQYVTSFLPAATIEPGQVSMTHTKFVFRLRKGVYLVHCDALENVGG